MKSFAEIESDILVGKRIRQRRRVLKMNQITLAKKVGVTYQQIQKYELGLNGVRASRLIEIAKVLKTTAGILCGDGIEIDEVADKLKIVIDCITELYNGLDDTGKAIEEVCTAVQGVVKNES